MCVCAFQRLRRESGSRLIELDSLTRRNRTLTPLFRGTMRSRLLALVRACGQRWDEVNTKLESTAARLKVPPDNTTKPHFGHFYTVCLQLTRPNDFSLPGLCLRLGGV